MEGSVEYCNTWVVVWTTFVSSMEFLLLHWLQYLRAIGLVAFLTASTDIGGGGGFFGKNIIYHFLNFY